jgi:bifunctional ADP-heptose synthase (sugar kinase/adenylyltransferase)
MKVLVIGETCVDKFLYCETNRLSPEAPVPVLNILSTTQNKGMAGNTSSNVYAIEPNAVVDEIHQLNIITKTRYVEQKSNHMFVRVDEGEEDIDCLKWGGDLKNKIINADIVIVSDYDKGFLSNYDIEMVGKLSKLSILDSKRILTNEIIKPFSFIKLNESEFNNNHNLNHKGIIVTLGSKGALYNSKIYPSPLPQDTIDVSGAGDTFTAAFIVKYHETKNISSSIKFANEKSSEVVSRRGVVTPK